MKQIVCKQYLGSVLCYCFKIITVGQYRLQIQISKFKEKYTTLAVEIKTWTYKICCYHYHQYSLVGYVKIKYQLNVSWFIFITKGHLEYMF